MKSHATTKDANLRLRLSSYLTLALACLGLGYAEQPFLEDILLWLLPLAVVLAVACVAEGRVLLPIWAANVLACLIFAVMGLWIMNSLQQADEGWMESGLGPAILLPYLGPFLMVLLAVKLFRPKQASDFWQLHGIGLMEMGLGAVLASDPAFLLFLFAYLTGAVWCLAQSHLDHGRAAAREPGGRRSISPWQVGRWVLASTALAALLFLITPRAGKAQWNPLRLAPSASGGNRELQTGFSESIDLNRTGNIEVNNEVVFDVQAQEKDGSPKLDLSEDQRWRASVLDHYQNGKWRRISLDLLTRDAAKPGSEGFRPDTLVPALRPGAPAPELGGGSAAGLPRSAGTVPKGAEGPQMREPSLDPPPIPRHEPTAPVNLGPRQFSLTFHINPRKVNRLVLADPLVYHSGPLAAAVVPTQGWPLFAEPPGYGTLQVARPTTLRDYIYTQFTMPLPEADLTPFPVQIDNLYLLNLGGQGVPPGLGDWTDQLLQRLAAGQVPSLTPADLEKVRIPEPLPEGPTSRLRPDRWEKVARALSDHLSSSGEYSYSLEIRRQDLALDAAIDFLQNTRQGHCERYASALALMLRSQGIPCRVVKGFRGAESRGDGVYDVRNSFAHSWVEALVERRRPLTPTPLPPRGEG